MELGSRGALREPVAGKPEGGKRDRELEEVERVMLGGAEMPDEGRRGVCVRAGPGLRWSAWDESELEL